MAAIGVIGGRKSLLFALFLAIFLPICIDQAAAVNAEGAVLLEFKQQLKDPNGTLSDWNAADRTPCSWFGITCEDGRVVKILIHGGDLSGSIMQSLPRLPFLHTLSLADNRFGGDLPGEIPGFSSLWKLNLSGNTFEGGIPFAIAQLPSLRMLDLSRNHLNGIIAEELFQSCEGKFRYISLARNNFSGRIPSSIGQCTDLIGLDLGFNGLLGSIPPSIGLLQELRYLYVQSNRLTGGVPIELGECSSLEIADLSGNLLSGSVPAEIGLISNLTELYISDNRLTGVPSEVLYSPSLISLNASINVLVGTIPGGSGSGSDCRRLSLLDLSVNQLGGGVPEDLCECSGLRLLNISHNRLARSLPARIGDLGDLHTLDLSFNFIRGTIPPDVRRMRSLSVLDLGSNPIVGEIPSGIGEMTLLQAVNLNNMALQGSIPAAIEQCKILNSLNLSNNSLNGTIPASMGALTSLKTLDLEHNRLSGTIPPELAAMVTLRKLDLSFNSITGTVPSELGGLSELASFNVSFNNLTGPIPQTGVLATFNSSSYIGNPSLCGPPLPLTCRPTFAPTASPTVSPTPAPAPVPKAPARIAPASPPLRHRHHRLTIGVIIAITAVTALTVGVIVVAVLSCVRRQRNKKKPLVYESFTSSQMSSPSTSPEHETIGKFVLFSETISAKHADWLQGVKALIEKHFVVGVGPMGTVHRAVVDGVPCALKHLEYLGDVETQEDFELLIGVFAGIRHPNLVELEGYYWSSGLKVLLTKYYDNHSLYHHLHDRFVDEPVLPWSTRMKIAIGTAKAVAFLHHDCYPPLLIFNLKSTNILLDREFVPHVSDYGLSRMLPRPDYESERRMGDPVGYMAPEVARQARVSEKLDVYSFGVVLLEIATGRRSLDDKAEEIVLLSEDVRKRCNEGLPERCLDQTVRYDMQEREGLLMLRLGLACTTQDPSKRPTMAEAVQILEKGF